MMMARRKILQSMRVLQRQRSALIQQQPLYNFSTEAAAADSTNAPITFQYPKSQELFQKITQQCASPEEMTQIALAVGDILGRYEREREFYYKGVGGKVSKGGASGGAAEEEESAAPAKTSFDVKLMGFDAKAKIKVIKEVRSIAGLGLKEAKELVESAPKVIQSDMKEDAANELKAKLEELGAQVEIL